MGLVLWIDENTVASRLIEKAFKGQSKEFYGLTQASDFAYLVRDLNPEVIVIDAKTVLKQIEVFKKQYEEHQLQNYAFIVLDPLPGLDFLQKKVGEIHRPLDPFSVAQVLEKKLCP